MVKKAFPAGGEAPSGAFAFGANPVKMAKKVKGKAPKKAFNAEGWDAMTKKGSFKGKRK